MKKKLTANLGLKILAVLFSVVIWFIVVNINDPVDKTVFRNVPVEILNTEAVTSQGKVYEILDETDVIDVTVWAKRSILDTLGKENVIATADMQEINFMDTMVRIKLATNKYNDKLENISSSTENMLISIEDMKREQFLITTVAMGEPAEGYILGSVSSDQNLVSLSGPESIVSRVDRAEVSVDVAGLSQDIRTDASIRLYDAENNLIEDKNLKKSLDQVKVSIEILQTKRVPIMMSAVGEPAEGYALTGEMESTPSTVLVAGKGSAIKNISQIEIPDALLNVAGMNRDLVTAAELKKYLPEGIVIAENDFDGKVSIKVHIQREITSELIIEPEEVVVSGMPENLKCEISVPEGEELALKVKGLPAAMEGLEDAVIGAQIDVAAYMEKHSLQELTAGEYMMSLQLVLPEGIRQDEELFVQVIVQNEDEENNDEE